MTDFRSDIDNAIRRFNPNHQPSVVRNVRMPVTPVAQRHITKNPSFASELMSKMSLISQPQNGGGKSILKTANKYLGIPYQMGGGRVKGPLRSVDCSSFVSRVYGDATNGRIKLTAYTDAMHDETIPISASEAQPGDLVFYSGNDPGQPGTRFPHVAIYAGNGQVVDASSMLGRVGYHQINMGSNLHPEFRRVKMPGNQPTRPNLPLK